MIPSIQLFRIKQSTTYPVLENKKTGHFGAKDYAYECPFKSLKSLQRHSFKSLMTLSGETSTSSKPSKKNRKLTQTFINAFKHKFGVLFSFTNPLTLTIYASYCCYCANNNNTALTIRVHNTERVYIPHTKCQQSRSAYFYQHRYTIHIDFELMVVGVLFLQPNYYYYQ